MRAVKIAFASFCLAALSGCLFTAIGLEHEELRNSIDFGPPETVHLCVYLDTGITEKEARELLSSWETEAPKYRLTVQPVSFQPLARSGFFHTGIVRQIGSQPLAPNCDRKLYFVNRNVGDFLWGDLAAAALPLPEVLGEVDDATLTSGFVVATRLSVNQLFFSPYAVTRHELFICWAASSITICLHATVRSPPSKSMSGSFGLWGFSKKSVSNHFTRPGMN